MPDGGKSKNNMSNPPVGGHNDPDTSGCRSTPFRLTMTLKQLVMGTDPLLTYHDSDAIGYRH